jgi:predicted amidohydrolase
VTAPLRLALCQWPVEPTPSVAAFDAKLDRWCAEAARAADLLLLPEYAPVELGAALAGRSPATEAEELAAMLPAAGAILAAMRRAAMRHGLWLAGGTLPMPGPDGLPRNRCPLIRPDGAIAFQDKRIMTRFEAERWGIHPGEPPAVFETPWGRLGISICYDIEFPKFARLAAEAGAWLILCPSCTDTEAGAERVRIGARARALENQLYVATAPTVGDAAWSAALDTNRGRAGVYGPVDAGFPPGGIVAEGPPDTPGLVTVTLDPAPLAHIRDHGTVRPFRDFPRAPMQTPRILAFEAP